MRQIPLILAFTLSLCAMAAHSNEMLTSEQRAAIEQEIRDALLAEQKAFQQHGCIEAIEFFADREPLFVADGTTVASRLALRSRCDQMPPRPPAGPRRQLQHHSVHVLSAAAGYSVTHYRLGEAEGRQVVTKIWEKEANGWRIVHLHESSARQPKP